MEEERLTEAEAFVAIALSAIYADGVLAMEEDVEVQERLHAFPLFARLDDAAMRSMFQRIDRLARKEGDLQLARRAAGFVSPHLRATAFLMAAEVIMADHDLTDEEMAYLEALANILGLDDATKAKVLEIEGLRNVRRLDTD